MHKNILYIWDSDYPWDVRTEKICRSLSNYGYGVHIAARNLKKRPVYENLDGIHIHRIRTWSSEKLNYFLSFPAFFSPIWKSFLDNIIIRHAIDLIIVRDLPMSIAGIWAGKRHGIPVIFDMAEDYVAMIWDIWRARKFQGLNLIVRNPYLAKLVEKYTFKNVDHVLVVVEEAKAVVVAGGGDAQRTTIIGNTPSHDLFCDHSGIKNSTDIVAHINNHFSVIYTGGVQMGRGLQTVIDAIPDLIDEIPDFLFVIVGSGYAVHRLKDRMTSLGVDKYVLWVGWVEHDEMYNYINASKVGIIPHLVTEHVNTTIPNKIFDYMGFGLPVVATNANPLKRIINEEHCGITYQSGNIDDLVKSILKIHSSPSEFGENGKKAVRYKYNWKEDEKRLNNLIGMFV